MSTPLKLVEKEDAAPIPLNTHIVHITDTTDDNARVKILSAYANHKYAIPALRNSQVDIVGSHSSIDIGVKVSELVNNSERPERLLLAVNVAPPDKDKGATGGENNHRKDFFLVELDNGDIIGGTINGHEMSYVRNRIKSLYRLTTTNQKDSQFRSLQELPKAITEFSDPNIRNQRIRSGAFKAIENILEFVPPPPTNTHVREVDNFGNVKLELSDADRELLESLPRGTKITIQFAAASMEVGGSITSNWRQTLNALIMRRRFTAKVAPKLFAAPNGTNALALNSSSTRDDGSSVPIIATLRDNPALTKPRYRLPVVGAEVSITVVRPIWQRLGFGRAHNKILAS